MLCYCIFCETGRCGKVASEVERFLGCKAIYPKQVQHRVTKGKPSDVERDLTPGYVFLYSDDAAPLDPHKLALFSGVIKCLRDSEGSICLSGDDEAFAMMLYKADGVIGCTKVYQEGEQIRLKDDAFAGVKAKILKVNRRNMRMLVEIPFFSMSIKTWVEYDLADKV